MFLFSFSTIFCCLSQLTHWSHPFNVNVTYGQRLGVEEAGTISRFSNANTSALNCSKTTLILTMLMFRLRSKCFKLFSTSEHCVFFSSRNECNEFYLCKINTVFWRRINSLCLQCLCQWWSHNPLKNIKCCSQQISEQIAKENNSKCVMTMPSTQNSNSYLLFSRLMLLDKRDLLWNHTTIILSSLSSHAEGAYTSMTMQTFMKQTG